MTTSSPPSTKKECVDVCLDPAHITKRSNQWLLDCYRSCKEEFPDPSPWEKFLAWLHDIGGLK